MTKDYYAVLNLDRDATSEEIKAAYREEVKGTHPDVAGNDPEKTARFQEITEAYKVLIDPYKRKMHDQELPMKSYPLRRPTAERVWHEATEVILLRSDRVTQFHHALQDATPIALEADRIIVGFSDENYRLARYLDVAADRRALLSALELVAGRPLEYRYIQGTTKEDWERIKAGEERVAARARRGPSFSSGAAQKENSWDELVGRIRRAHSRLPDRHYPQNLAAFMREALSWIRETEERELGSDSPEYVARGLAKAIERLARLVDLPPLAVALELAREGDLASRQA